MGGSYMTAFDFSGSESIARVAAQFSLQSSAFVLFDFTVRIAMELCLYVLRPKKCS